MIQRQLFVATEMTINYTFFTTKNHADVAAA
jgi:hypothetical protein